MVRAVDMIEAKKQGGAHRPDELAGFVRGYCAGEVPDYQMAAWLMAVRWRGLNGDETASLTRAMAASGERLDLAAAGLPEPYVDKHSTGGVGDKLSLIVVPVVIAAGATVVKLSGPGLGHTGGTVDKLEAIPGFRAHLPTDEMFAVARAAGGCMAAHTSKLVPADGMMYALRDATATVDSLPLIAASIMAKKIACGARALVLDVKAGRGAFMRSPGEALELARLMVEIARSAGVSATALLTSMDQPLGRAIGNALEVNEALDVLAGGGPAEVRGLAVALAAHALVVAGLEQGVEGATASAGRLLASGRAMERFQRLVGAQGGVLPPRVAEGNAGLPAAALAKELAAPRTGTIAAVDAYAAGRASVLLGAGRSRKGERVDPGAGIELLCAAGQPVAAGQPLAVLYASDAGRLEFGLETLRHAFTWAEDAGDVLTGPPYAAAQPPGSVLGVVAPPPPTSPAAG